MYSRQSDLKELLPLSEFIWSVVKPIMNHKLDPSGNQQVNTGRWDKVFSG
jgi:hypothetical protein